MQDHGQEKGNHIGVFIYLLFVVCSFICLFVSSMVAQKAAWQLFDNVYIFTHPNTKHYY